MHAWRLMGPIIGPLLCLLAPSALAASPGEGTPARQTYRFEDGSSYAYERPTLLGWVKRGVTDLAPFAQDTFRADNLDTLALLLGGTAVLVHEDQHLYEETREFGARRGISQDAGGSSFQALPRNFGNYLYFIGDGRVPVAIAGTLAAAGYLQDDVRLLSTASQLAEAMLSTAVICQGMKQTLGRESPEVRSRDGGEWHGPQALPEYVRHENRYDAMPSGHLATAVATMTVLAENFHEHETAIYSVGGLLATLLSFQMVNNGVHWASDYPIGAAIGYEVGQVVTRNNRTVTGTQKASSLRFDLAAVPGGLEVEARARF